MGDIADMMINGDLDLETGEYLGEGQGFPRTREKHHSNNSQLRGVQKFLESRNIPKSDVQEIVKKFVIEVLNVSKKVQKAGLRMHCQYVQAHFGKFAKWISEEKYNNPRE